MNFTKTTKLLWSVYLLFTLIWIFRFWGHFPAVMDTMEYVFPEKWFNVQSFQQGLIPLWNPYIACGTPHVANFQSAAFYPPFWIWNFTGLTNWFFALAIGHVLLAAFGFYLWLRVLKVTAPIASLCAISFSGSAYLTFLWAFPTHLASFAWLPWIFWVTEKLIQKFSPGRWLGLAVFWAFQILAGYPIFTFYALLFWFVFLAARIKLDRKNWYLVLSAGAAALFVTACQWLPFLDFLGYMHREAWGSNIYNLRWAEYITLISPDALGTPGSTDYRGDYNNFIFGNFYLGWVPLFILIWSLIQQKAKLSFWQKSLIFCMFLPLGAHFVLWRFLPNSWWDKLEVSKSSFLFVFCAFTALAFYLNQAILKIPKRSPLHRFAWIFILIWVLDLILIPFRIVHLVPNPFQNDEVKTFAEKIKTLAGDGRVVSLRFQDQVYSSAVTDLASSFNETAKHLVQNTNVVWGIKSAQGHLTTVVDGYQNLTEYIREGFPYEGRILDAAGVDIILTAKPLSAFKYRVNETAGDLSIVRNAGSMPSQWVTDKEKIFEQRSESFGHLLNPKTFLENECGLDKDRNGEVTALRTEGVCVRSSLQSPCSLQFSTAGGSAKYFVLDQSFAPGWHAWVDGRPSPVLRADGLWMAVGLTQGAPHQILFQYAPYSFRLGLFVTLVVLSGLLWFGVRSGLKLH
jgi:hypothetical protein